MPFELEAMSASDVFVSKSPVLSVRNVYFEAVPSRFFAGVISERGVVQHHDLREDAERHLLAFLKVFATT